MMLAVFDIPSDKWGEMPLAVVIPKSGIIINETALKAWVNEHDGARHQRIHAVVFTKISVQYGQKDPKVSSATRIILG